MRAYFVVVLLGLASLGIRAVPVPELAEDADEDSADRIAELRKKLDNLHKALEELNHNLEEFDEELEEEQEEEEDGDSPTKKDTLPEPPPVDEQDQLLQEFEAQLSPDDKKLLLKMHSKVKFLQAALHEPDNGPNPGDVDEEQAEAPAKREQAGMEEVLAQLSPEDQALIEKHPSMFAHLQKALEEQKQGDHNGEEKEEVDKREQSADLEELLSQLSPEDQALLKKHPSKMAALQKALQQQQNGDHNGQEEPDVPDEPPVRRQQFESVDDMISHLSAQDKQLIEKNPSMLHYLEEALQEQQQGDHNGPSEGDLPPPARRANSELQAFMDELPPEDQKLLQAHPSVWLKLQKAVEVGGHEGEEPNVDELAAEEERKRGQEAQEELEDFVKNLTPEDKELLQKMRDQLEKVKEAIEEYHENKRGEQDDEYNGEDDKYNKPEDDTGDSAEDDGDKKRKQDDEYNGEDDKYNKPEDDTGDSSEDDGDKKRKQDDEYKGEDDKYNKPEDDTGDSSENDSDKRSHNVDPRCKDGKRCQHDGAMSEVEKRFLNDVQYARSKGVDLHELLRVLSARKVREVTEEEMELELLSNH